MSNKSIGRKKSNLKTAKLEKSLIKKRAKSTSKTKYGEKNNSRKVSINGTSNKRYKGLKVRDAVREGNDINSRTSLKMNNNLYYDEYLDSDLYPKSKPAAKSTGRTRSNVRLDRSVYKSPAKVSPARKRRLKRINNRSIKFVTMTVFLVMFVYLGLYSINFLSKDAVAYDTIQYGSIDTPKTAEGIIVRSEQVYSTTAAGVVSYNVSDNEKVRAGDIVCSIKDEAVVSSIEEELEKTNQSMLDLQESRDDMSWFSEDVKRLNSQIADIIDNNANNYVKLDISEIYELKSNVQKKLDTRNQMLLSENKGSLQDLANKKSQQEEQISKSILSLSSSQGGIVSYSIDGLEEAVTVENVDNLTKEQTTMKPEKTSSFKNQVAASDKVFKIVTSNIWYIASYMPNTYIENWEIGDFKTIYISGEDGEKTQDVKIKNIIAGEKESFIVFEVTKNIIDYIDKRNVSFVINKAKVGYKIVNSAIIEETLLKIPVQYLTEDNSIHKVTDEGISYLNINISGTSDDKQFVYTTIDKNILQVGDTVQNPKDSADKYVISQVENITGVYIMNTGIAEFRKVNMENSSKNSTHTVIDPSLNANIKLYDRIITDTTNITKEQKLY